MCLVSPLSSFKAKTASILIIPLRLISVQTRPACHYLHLRLVIVHADWVAPGQQLYPCVHGLLNPSYQVVCTHTTSLSVIQSSVRSIASITLLFTGLIFPISMPSPSSASSSARSRLTSVLICCIDSFPCCILASSRNSSTLNVSTSLSSRGTGEGLRGMTWSPCNASSKRVKCCDAIVLGLRTSGAVLEVIRDKRLVLWVDIVRRPRSRTLARLGRG